MTDTDLLEVFADEVIRGVAAEDRVDESLLRDALADHQRTMRETPGVEDLVYEWRKQYENPVLERTAQCYVVGVPRAVWDEFGTYLDLDDYLLAAVSAVHQEQVLRRSGVDAADLHPDHVPMIAVRD